MSQCLLVLRLLFAKTEPVATFFETELFSPENRGRNAEQLETEGS